MNPENAKTSKAALTLVGAEYDHLLGGIHALITTARQVSVRAVNAVMTATYWDIGRQIVEFEQGGKARAAYGTSLLGSLSADLTARHGRGFSVDNLERFRLFYQRFPLPEISATALRKSISLIRLRQIPQRHCGIPIRPSRRGLNSSRPDYHSPGRTTRG
jgi:hypothetical protein